MGGGQMQSSKIIQLIIILMDSSEFTAGPRKRWKEGVTQDRRGGLLVTQPQVRVSTPPANFSFSRSILFFFFYGAS